MGEEKDDEIKGEGNHIAYAERGYDPRIGRWISMDTYAPLFPSHSPYNYALNNPIYLVDAEGNYPKPSELLSDDTSPLIKGMVDGVWEGLTGSATFVLEYASDPEFRDTVNTAFKALVNDPIGTLEGVVQEYAGMIERVATGNATDEDVYNVGAEIGEAGVGIILRGSTLVAKSVKKLLKPNITKGKIAKKIETPKTDGNLPIMDNDPLIGKHKDLKVIKDGKQSHHLNQDAAFRDMIPTNDGAAVKLEGNAFSEINSPHYKAHASLENFWNQYRKGGAKFGENPTVIEYSKALKKSLIDAGFSNDQALKAVRAATKNRIENGILGGQDVPRIPGKINQKKG